MKTHGPNSPQTIRGLRERRKLRGVLDTRREQEADLRTVEYVQPFGSQFHLVKNPGGGTPFLVADQTGGRTFAPQSSVLSASATGKHGEAILGGAPAGKKGGQSRSVSPRRRGTPAAAETNQYAFGQDGSESFALLYADGEYVSTRAVISGGLGGGLACILDDSSSLLGVGALMQKDGNDLYIWDVENATTYTYTAPAGWRALTPLYYNAGMVYWFEGEDVTTLVTTSFDIRLRTAKTDLTDDATIQTVTRDIATAQTELGGSTLEYFMDTEEYAAGIAVDDNGAVVYFGIRPQDGNGERSDVWSTQFRFALIGGTPSERPWAVPEGTTFSGVTLAAQSFVLAVLRVDLGGNTAIMSKTDDASGAMGNLWGDSALDSYGFTTISLGAGGSTVQVHSAGGFLLRGTSVGAVVATTISAFNDTPSYPSAMFFFGE